MDALQGFISQEIDDVRKAGQEHYKRSFNALFEKYSSIDPEHGGDVIDVEKLQIVEDHGYIQNMNPRPMSFANQYYIQRKAKQKLRRLSKKIKRFRKKNKKASAKVLNSVNCVTAEQSEKIESAKPRKSNSFTTYDITKTQDSSNSHEFPETSGLNENNPAKQSKKRESTKPSRSNSFTTPDIAKVLHSSNSAEFSKTPGLNENSPAKQSKKRRSTEPRRSNSSTLCDISKGRDSCNTIEFSENSSMNENNKQFATVSCTPKSDGTKKSVHKSSLYLNSIDKLFSYPQCKLDLTPVNRQKSHSSVMERSPLTLLKGVKMDDIISCGTPNIQHAVSSEQVTDYSFLKKHNEQFIFKCDSPKLRRRKTIKPKTAAKSYTACNRKSLSNNREKLFICSPLKSVSTPINPQRPFSLVIAKSPRMSLKGIKVDDLCNVKYAMLDQVAHIVKKNN